MKLGELNSFARFIPDTGLFITMHIYAEAVVSSRIEGTKTQMEEAFLRKNEINPENRDDWQEVINYVQAINSAVKSFDKLGYNYNAGWWEDKNLIPNIKEGILSLKNRETRKNMIEKSRNIIKPDGSRRIIDYLIKKLK